MNEFCAGIFRVRTQIALKLVSFIFVTFYKFLYFVQSLKRCPSASHTKIYLRSDCATLFLRRRKKTKSENENEEAPKNSSKKTLTQQLYEQQ